MISINYEHIKYNDKNNYNYKTYMFDMKDIFH